MKKKCLGEIVQDPGGRIPGLIERIGMGAAAEECEWDEAMPEDKL